MLGLRFCARAFSSCGKRGPLFIAVHRPLTIATSLVAEHRLQTRRLSSCGSQAQLLRSMWDLPRPGLEPVSPALAGRFSTTAPPGKSSRTLNSPPNWPSWIHPLYLWSFISYFLDLFPLDHYFFGRFAWFYFLTHIYIHMLQSYIVFKSITLKHFPCSVFLNILSMFYGYNIFSNLS